MTTSARHVRNGPTQRVTWTQWTPSPASPVPAVRVEPWQPSDPATAYRLAAASHREAGEVLDRVSRLEARCDRLTVALVVVAAVALFAVAAAWLW